MPEDLVLMDWDQGDLDQDGLLELVAAYHTAPIEDREDTIRELIIFKWNGKEWLEWKKSKQALLGSQDGGAFGDPFDEIEIRNGLLLIRHHGGSSWKWTTTDTYRFQDGDFYLIWFSEFSFKKCEQWLSIELDLSTGKGELNKESEPCDSQNKELVTKETETFFIEGLKITLACRQEKEIKIFTPKSGYEVFISNGKDN